MSTNQTLTQQTFLDQAYTWDTLHVAGQFASNGVVTVRIKNLDSTSLPLAQLVHRYRNPAKLPEARLVTRLPAINNLPPSLVFAPIDWKSAELQRPDLAGLYFIAHDLYNLITGRWDVDGDFWNYRVHRDNNYDEPKPVLIVYDIDLEMVGFCCGLRIRDHDREAVKAALSKLLIKENPDPMNPEIFTRSAAEVGISGLGVWDVFKMGGKLVGQVACYMGDPPFVVGNDPHFDFAPGFYLFPAGVVEVDRNGQRVDVHPDGSIWGEWPDCGFPLAVVEEGGLWPDCGPFSDLDGKIFRAGEYPSEEEEA